MKDGATELDRIAARMVLETIALWAIHLPWDPSQHPAKLHCRREGAWRAFLRACGRGRASGAGVGYIYPVDA